MVVPAEFDSESDCLRCIVPAMPGAVEWENATLEKLKNPQPDENDEAENEDDEANEASSTEPG